MNQESSPERKADPKLLVKVSGDLIESEPFYNWLTTLKTGNGHLFILCGGGTAITTQLEEHNIPYRFTATGREIDTAQGRIMAQNILEFQKKVVEKKLKDIGLTATVIIPSIPVEGDALHMNGDSMAEALHPNFDKIYVVTTEDRVKTFPAQLSKIEVIHLGENYSVKNV